MNKELYHKLYSQYRKAWHGPAGPVDIFAFDKKEAEIKKQIDGDPEVVAQWMRHFWNRFWRM